MDSRPGRSGACSACPTRDGMAAECAHRDGRRVPGGRGFRADGQADLTELALGTGIARCKEDETTSRRIRSVLLR